MITILSGIALWFSRIIGRRSDRDLLLRIEQGTVTTYSGQVSLITIGFVAIWQIALVMSAMVLILMIA